MVWQGTRVLVTGGAGFIGSNLAHGLISQGAIVKVVDDLSSGSVENIPDSAQFFETSITDRAAMSHALEEVDFVFHLAAIASVPLCEQDPEGSSAVNRDASLWILEEAGCPVVFASSAAIYGHPVSIPIDESHPLSPLGEYGQQKADVDLRILSGAHTSSALRFFNVYGYGQDPSSPYSGVLSIFTDRTLAGQGITIFGDGEQTRDFVHVSDVVKACLSVGESLLQDGFDSVVAGQSYNVCTGSATTLNAVVETIARIMGKDIHVTHSVGREGEIDHSLGNSSKITEHLGWMPEINLEEGLTDLLGLS